MIVESPKRRAARQDASLRKLFELYRSSDVRSREFELTYLQYSLLIRASNLIDQLVIRKRDELLKIIEERWSVARSTEGQ